MKIPKEILNDINEYCKINDILDVDKYIVKIIKQGHLIEKFGSTPYSKEPQIITKEVIKEVIVEKEIYVSDDIEIKKLTTNISDLIEKNSKLEKELKLLSKVKKESTPKKKEVINKKEEKTDLYGE